MSEDDEKPGRLIDFGESKRKREERARAESEANEERTGFLRSHSDPTKPRCYHRFDAAVQVDTEAREVSCSKCGALLDPIEVLSWFARICDDVTWARAESRRIREENVKHEKRLKAVRAAVRREVEKARAAGLVEGTQAVRSKRTQWIRTSENDRLAEVIERGETSDTEGGRA